MSSICGASPSDQDGPVPLRRHPLPGGRGSTRPLIPPFISVPGLGETAALSMAEQREGKQVHLRGGVLRRLPQGLQDPHRQADGGGGFRTICRPPASWTCSPCWGDRWNGLHRWMGSRLPDARFCVRIEADRGEVGVLIRLSVPHQSGEQRGRILTQKEFQKKRKELFFMLDAKVAQLLNEQVNKEFYSAYLYLDFCQSTMSERGPGRLCQLVQGAGAGGAGPRACSCCSICRTTAKRPTLEAVAKPDRERDQPPAGAASRRAASTSSTSPRLIHAIYDAAYSAKDFRTMQFLDWFVKEQGEEEKNAEDLIKKIDALRRATPRGCICSTARLAARVYTAPSLVL